MVSVAARAAVAVPHPASLISSGARERLCLYSSAHRCEQHSEKRKGDHIYVEAESLATLSPVLMWKVANIHKEFVDFAKEISRQTVEDISWFPLAAYSEMLREMLKKSWLNTKKPGLTYWS